MDHEKVFALRHNEDVNETWGQVVIYGTCPKCGNQEHDIEEHYEGYIPDASKIGCQITTACQYKCSQCGTLWDEEIEYENDYSWTSKVTEIY